MTRPAEENWQIETAPAWKLHVRNYARVLISEIRTHEVLDRGERPRLHLRRVHKSRVGGAHRWLIVHDIDLDWRFRHQFEVPILRESVGLCLSDLGPINREREDKRCATLGAIAGFD